MVDKTQHRKLKIEDDEHILKRG